MTGTTLLAPARADTSPPIRTAPYDGTGGWDGCDASPGSVCEGEASGNAATGRLQNTWTVTSPDGGASPGQANGRGDRSVWADLALAEPAGAVELTFRIRIDAASATTTNPEGGFAETSLFLTGIQTDCGGGCMAITSEVLASTVQEEEVRHQAGEIVRTVRIVNQMGGNVPAGTIRAVVETYGGAFIGNYQTGAAGSSSIVTDMTWTSVEATFEPAVPEPPPPGGSREIVVSRPYVGGGKLADALFGCQSTFLVRPAAGGACFLVPTGATSAQVSVGDAVNDPVGATAGDAPPTPFCGRSERIALTPYSYQFPVRVDGPLDRRCGLASFGTTGVITVTFEVPTPNYPARPLEPIPA